MDDLTPRDRELVALGAALGSNCVPCVEYHIPEARKAGLSDDAIRAAIHHADKIRQVPARKTLQAALSKLEAAKDEAGSPGTGPGSGCGAAAGVGSESGTSGAPQPMDVMLGMMSRMMAKRCGTDPSAGAPKPSEEKPAADPATAEGCGCG